MLPHARQDLRNPKRTAGSVIALCGALLVSEPISGALARQDEPRFPSPAEWRELQLLALSCSRQNDEGPCRDTRTQADMHLDNILLPTSCKDVLWELTQMANPGSSNTFQRRDRIAAAAKRLTLVCRQTDKRRRQPSHPSGAPAGPAPPPAC